jgi:hypothetical protein
MNNSPVTVIVVQGGELVQPQRFPADVRGALAVPIAEIEQVRSRLTGLAAWLPEPPEAMLQEEIPFDFNSELLTTVQHVLASYIEPALDELRRSSRVTPEQLFADWQAGKSMPSGPKDRGPETFKE